MGYKLTDYNGADQEGFSRMQSSVRNGERSNSALEFLSHGNRPNLHIALRSHVIKVKIEKKRATGVYVVRNGRKYFIKAKKEVILSAGAINSPQILMPSGIGPEQHLKKIGIDVITDLPVGENLQDHVMLWIFSRINSSDSITGSGVQSWWSQLQYMMFKSGPFSVAGTEGMAFLYTDENERGKTYADIQLIFLSAIAVPNFLNLRDEVAKEYITSSLDANGFTSAIVLTHPMSKGSIRLKSSDPFEPPVIDPKYLNENKDIEKMTSGLRIWEKLMATRTFREVGVNIDQSKVSFCSHHEFRSDAYWECYMHHLILSVWHQSCTCKWEPKTTPHL